MFIMQQAKTRKRESRDRQTSMSRLLPEGALPRPQTLRKVFLLRQNEAGRHKD